VWNFTVKGFNGAGELILRGELKNQNVSYSSNSFNFVVSPLLEGSGSVHITIILPINTGITESLVFRDGVREELPLLVTDGRIVYNVEAAAGDYYYSFRLNNSQGNSIAVVSETVQVRSFLRSEATIELTAADLNAAPATPAAPQLAVGDGQLTVSWVAVPMVGDYEVYYSDTSSPPAAPVRSVSNATSAVISGLTNGTLYYVWVKSLNAAGSSGFSESASGTPLPLPVAPEQPTLVIGDGQLVVSWDAVPWAAVYDVYYSESATPPAAALQSSVTTDAVIGGLVNGRLYYVWVKARNAAGTSGFSAVASETPLPIPVAPEQPTLVIEDGQLALSWNAVSWATDYDVYYSEAATPPEAPAQSVSDATDALLSELTNGTLYYVWVKARNAAGTSVYSASASGTPLPLPAAPEQPSLSAGDGQLTISWSEVPWALSYEVYYSESPVPPDTPERTVVGSTSVVLSGLNSGTIYYVWLKAKNARGSSSYSEPASGTPLESLALSVTLGNGLLTLTWAPVAATESYEVYYSETDVPPEPVTPSNVIINGAVNPVTARIDGLIDGVTYYIWVEAKDAGGAVLLSGHVSATFGLLPPGNLQAITQSAESILLSWDEPVIGGASYQVYRAGSSGGAYTRIGESVTLSYTDTDLAGGATYWYKVSTKKGSESALTSAVSATTRVGTTINITLSQSDVDLSAQSTSITRGQSRTFEVTGSYATYQWYLGGFVISGATVSSYTLSTSSLSLGVYELTVIVNAGTSAPLSGSCYVRVE
jgi:fibronectin type 3 domain-containing protein